MQDGIFVIMLNSNGWRNPSIFGGGEIQTINTINKINNLSWILVLPSQLRNIIKDFNKKNLRYFFVSPIFKETNIFLDIIQGICLFSKVIIIGLKERKRYNLVYASTTNFADIFSGYILAILTKKSLVTKYHISLYKKRSFIGIYRSYREEKNLFFDSFIRAVLAKITLFFMESSDKVFVVSNYLKKQLKNIGFEDKKIVVNYNGIDFDSLGQLRLSKYEKNFDLCFMGRIEESKGVFEYIRLISSLKKKNPKIQAVLIGDGTMLKTIKNNIKKENLSENVVVTGFLKSDRYTLLQQSKVFVSPTFANEGFGLSIIESIFFGVPVVAYKQEVFEEIFNGHEMVRLIKHDEKDLIDSVEYFLNEKNVKSSKQDLSSFDLNLCSIREEKELLSILKR